MKPVVFKVKTKFSVIHYVTKVILGCKSSKYSKWQANTEKLTRDGFNFKFTNAHARYVSKTLLDWITCKENLSKAK